MDKPKRSHKRSAFLEKTYDMLNNQEYREILCWGHDGIGFIIRNCSQFSETVLPAYFKHSNFNSFIRQLNMYGFSKKRSSKDENYYFHSKFVKNRKQLINEIQRRAQKKNNKNSEKDIRIQSQFSIQLQSNHENKRSQHPPNTIDKLGFQFYKLMNVNQTLLNSQIEVIGEIIKDFKALKLKDLNHNLLEVNHRSFHQKENESIGVLTNYLNSQFQLRSHLLQKGKQKINDSERMIQSMAKFQTEQTLQQQMHIIRNLQLSKFQ